MMKEETPHTTDPPRIAVFLCFLNAGMTTRGIEIAKSLLQQRHQQPYNQVKIGLFSWEGPDSFTYDHLAKDIDCEVFHYGPPIDHKTWKELLEAEHEGKSMIDKKDFFVAHMKGAVEALQAFAPHVVVHGALPDASVAAQILKIPHIMFTPIPLGVKWIQSHLLTDIPDAQSNWLTDLMPKWLRQHLMKFAFAFHRRLIKNTAMYQAAIECGWNPADEDNDSPSLSVAPSNWVLLTDLASNYEENDLEANVKIVGPLFAKHENILSPEIQNMLNQNGPKVFVTMGSTGGKDFLIEAVKALSEGNYYALVAMPPGRCSVEEIHEYIRVDESRILLTQEFVPADVIASQVDVVVGHGGQGTVQNALAAGTPIIGVALQMEQQFNLDNMVKKGAAIRIAKRQWKARIIRQTIDSVLENKSYKSAAKRVQEEISKTNSADDAAKWILKNLE